MNRYAYVEGAPESFVDVLGFFRAAAAIQAQKLAAAQAAYDAVMKAYNAVVGAQARVFSAYVANVLQQVRAIQAQATQRAYEKTVKLANLRMANDKAQAQIEADRGKLWLYNTVNTFKDSAPDMVTMARNEVIGVGKFVAGMTPIPDTVKSVKCMAGGWSAMNACAQDARNEQKAMLQTLQKVVAQVAVRDQLAVGVLTGNASIGDWWDAAYQIPRDLTFGPTLDACKAGQYDKCGQGIGQAETGTALFFIPGADIAAAPAVAIDAVRTAEIVAADAEAATVAEVAAAQANAAAAAAEAARIAEATRAAQAARATDSGLAATAAEARVSGMAASVDSRTLTYTQTVMNNAATRPYIGNSMLIDEIMSTTPRMDPGGVPTALRWDAPGTFSQPWADVQTVGTYELVIDTSTNTVLHFLFKAS